MDSLTIKYQLKKEVCTCCYQALPEPQTSSTSEFTFNKEQSLSYAPWEDILEDQDEFEEFVEEYASDTIQFFAGTSTAVVMIEKSEIDKVKEFLKTNVKNAAHHKLKG
ncbi:hypothetical protein [Jeotgalibacillus terrae]|uniref:Uncharacterized protein n=1 Tax=Jeotgalibacillus terrae TaxID=587735 RepID=A0ABW5ZGF1_9BACL|nr:hypothetical protein [Jeotgalibacillus terrae]MBM7580034.1 hypothetical protein [Jeotgalibacillus terrae]